MATIWSAGWLIILLGVLSSIQLHLAKALERQGIETLDMIRARLQGRGGPIVGSVRKPLIYTVGLILNHTVFIYALFVAPLGGSAALYTSMYGTGLVALLLYARWELREEIARVELIGAAAIVAGTAAIGIDSVARPGPGMAGLRIGQAGLAAIVLLAVCVALIVAGLRMRSPRTIGLAFGLCAGACGALDPFLKAAGQAAGGAGGFAPHTPSGWVALAASFVAGGGAVLITQWGFYRRAQASSLVPAYDCAYVGVPVALQLLLLPGYALTGVTAFGLGLILAGIIAMRAGRPGALARPGDGEIAHAL